MTALATFALIAGVYCTAIVGALAWFAAHKPADTPGDDDVLSPEVLASVDRHLPETLHAMTTEDSSTFRMLPSLIAEARERSKAHD